MKMANNNVHAFWLMMSEVRAVQVLSLLRKDQVMVTSHKQMVLNVV